jgi:exportin-2 (importin alpha re-exporter)
MFSRPANSQSRCSPWNCPLTPSALQIFAQIISLRPQPLPEMYSALYQGILNAELWKRSGNVPALNTLLRTFVAKGPEIVTQGRLEPVLGVMQNLIGSKANDHEGLELFSVLFESIPMATLDAFLTQVFNIFLMRLMKSRTTKYTHALMKTCSLFVCLHGAQIFVAKLDSVQPGCFNQIFTNIWLPEVQKLQSTSERKAVGCAMVKMLEEPAIQANPEMWIQILTAVMKLIELPVEEATADGDEDFLHQEGYDNTYCKLHFATERADMAAKLPDTRTALVQAQAALQKGMPMIQQKMPQDAQAKLGEYFQVAGIRLA